MNPFCKLVEDVHLTRRWHLGELTDAEGNELDCRDFTYGHRIDLCNPLVLSLRHEDTRIQVSPPLILEIQKQGPPLDMTLGAFDTLVASKKAADLLQRLCGEEVQRFPVTIGNYSSEFEIINCARTVDCLDTERSEIEWWTAEDHRPDKAGQPRMITDLVIDPRRTEGANIFRIKNWDVVMVVSNKVVTALKQAGIKGVAFQPCS